MPRGRHRHSPPLHRMLPPSAIAGVSVVCALGPWVFTQPVVLRLLAAAAAATAVVGAVVMRHWDAQAGKRVADLTRARASDEWRFEERVAELESDLEESRELRQKLEQRLRAKRAELAGLRNEHAALLRRYAAAEAERANVLEERRVLEIEAAVPARALPAGASATPDPEPAAAESAASEPETETPETETTADAERTEDAQEETTSGVFSPEGSKLYLKADAALARFAGQRGPKDEPQPEATAGEADGKATGETAGKATREADSDAPEETAAKPSVPAARKESAPGAAKAGDAPQSTAGKDGGTPEDDGPGPAKRRKPEPAQEDEAGGQSRAAGDHERAAAPTAPAASAAPAVRRPAGHFTVPTAVAVVPPTQPVRRPVQDDGFDFFGTKQDARRSALDAVQNEDLADVVGQEALALHKAEEEAQYKPASEETRAGQVIDLTAHDETERIDVQGLRSAVS
ncbi:hypothetical protein ACFSUJ_18990 [Streptomyces lusitanus]|uniref:Secreted protein n=1 Tax=Streptomyces lusitanus TaxID=68232 RepID=A0ABU3JW13_9ACTN|nr:hypothetical protein [Streptomyces lusitanus]